MKKLISVLLSCLILISGFWACLSFTASAVTTGSTDSFYLKEDEYFATFKNWDRNWSGGSDTSKITLPSDITPSGEITIKNGSNRSGMAENTDAALIKAGSSSIKLFSTAERFNYILLPDLEVGKQYNLSFYYYTNAVTTGGYAFNSVGVYAPEVTDSDGNYTANLGSNYGATKNGQTDGYLSYLHYDSNYSFISKGGIKANGHTPVANNLSGDEAGRWNKVELEFSTLNLTEDMLNYIYLVLLPYGTNANRVIYVDDFRLTEGEDPNLSNADNWGITNSKVSITKETNLPGYGDLQAIKENDSLEYGGDAVNGEANTWIEEPVLANEYVKEGASSVLAHGNAVYAYVKLPNVKQNTEYRVSFSYYSNGLSNYTSSSSNFNYLITRTGVFAPNVTNAAISQTSSQTEKNGYLVSEGIYDHQCYSTVDGITSTATKYKATNPEWSTRIDDSGKWHDLELEFNSGSQTELFLIINISPGTVNGTKDYDIYFDNLKFEETKVDYKDIDKWLKAGSGSTTLFSDKDGYIAPDAAKGAVSLNTDAKYDYNGDKNSVKLGTSLTSTYWSGQCFGINLENIKKNTEYILSFKYMTPIPRQVNGYSYAFQYAGIFAHTVDGAAINNAGNARNNGYLYSMSYNNCTASIDGTAANRVTSLARTLDGVEANTWHKANLPFYSGSLNESLIFVVSVAQTAVFLDDFEIIEVEKPEDETADCAIPALSDKTPEKTLYTEKADSSYYSNTTEDDFTAYCETLEADGFEQYTTNEIGTNKFAVYTKYNTTVSVAFYESTSKLVVSHQATDTLPALKDENRIAGYVEPFMAQLNNLNSSGVDGMSYAYRLDDGRFIVIDGGTAHTNSAQADSIYNFLKENSETEDIKIAAWIISHAHTDHMGGFSAFVERYHDEVEIEQLIYNFPDQELIAGNSNVASVVQNDPDRLGTFYRNVTAYLPDTKISTAHTGYKYHIGNAIVEILYTFEDYENSVSTIYDFNVTSTVCRVYFEGYEDKATVFFADALAGALKTIAERYPAGANETSPINSYFMQLAHHGYNTDSGNAKFTEAVYSLVNPTVALWPVGTSRFKTIVNQASGTYVMGNDNVKEIVLSDYGTRKFTKDYVAVESENKFSLPNPTDTHELNLESISTSVGFSIRKQSEKSQAVRFKFKVPSELVGAKCNDGYYLAEYGVMLTKQDNLSADATMLDYYDGTAKSQNVDGVGTKYKGIVYNGEKLYVDTKAPYESYANANEVGYFFNSTVAMTNVGYISANDTTNYTEYDTVYSFRPYFAFKNTSGEVYVHYGDTANASVFDVMNAILSTDETGYSGDALTALQSDKQYVKDFLDGKIEGHNEAEAVAEIQSQWNSVSDRASLYSPAPVSE